MNFNNTSAMYSNRQNDFNFGKETILRMNKNRDHNTTHVSTSDLHALVDKVKSPTSSIRYSSIMTPTSNNNMMIKSPKSQVTSHSKDIDHKKQIVV